MVRWLLETFNPDLILVSSVLPVHPSLKLRPLPHAFQSALFQKRIILNKQYCTSISSTAHPSHMGQITNSTITDIMIVREL